MSHLTYFLFYCSCEQPCLWVHFRSRDEPCSSHFSLRIYIIIVTRKIIGFAVSGRHVSSFPLSRPFSNGLELIRDVLPLFFLQVKVPEWSDLVGPRQDRCRPPIDRRPADVLVYFRKRHSQGPQAGRLERGWPGPHPLQAGTQGPRQNRCRPPIDRRFR
ncbi:hypothetical protein PRIPAC_78099 [Pristionchus pacificus]|uniref:Uncharacterized protein n=1 Tax=Pristionchus pacificus TaxID=54126 RepID=A0A2A6BHV8_PRIPA|nr:hypothetical protein PRIPAC_78099 [Pristionchus pacificus]|eukprot:PDM65416.1 hypothetical protein PRIPAC_52358 [Pristionchus pacificus]